MTWILLALIPTLLWSMVNFIDKAVISKFFKGFGESAVITTGFAGFVMALFIVIIHPSQITQISNFYKFIAIINGFIFVTAFMPYCKALEIDDASRVSMVYQTIPIFGFILGSLFLNEKFGAHAIFGAVLILIGSFIVMLESINGKWKIKRKTLLLMLLSSFMTAFHVFLFKFVSLEQSFWSTGFWVYVGMALCGIVLYVIPYYRKSFNNAVKGSAGLVLFLGTFTEIMSIVGLTIISFVSLKVPIALVQTINGFQPVVVIILGFILTKTLPNYFNESFSKKNLLVKITAFVIMIFGVSIISNF